MSSAHRVLIIFAHPALEKSRVNRQLLQALQGLEGVTIHDLYENYPNFYIDVKAEQYLLLSHHIVVFQHPFYWYSSPSLLKEWQDLVLEYGFAYGRGGTALQGKKVLSAVTTGGSPQAYQREGQNFFTMRELLVPFEQTARLCGMDYLPPFVVQSTHQLRDQEQITLYAQQYCRAIEALRDNRIHWDFLQQMPHFNTNLDLVIQPQEIPHHA